MHTETQSRGCHERLVVRRRWRKGQAPKDGNKYEVRRRFRVSCALDPTSPYVWHTAVWSTSAWWNGKSYAEHNQFSGGERWLNQPDEWRESPNEQNVRLIKRATTETVVS